MLYIIILVIYIIALLAFIVWVLQHILTVFNGAPFVVSSEKRRKDILKLLDPKPGEKIIDLGSGNGVILFDIASFGAKSHGIEINPLLVWSTKRAIKTKKLSHLVSVKRGNLFNENLRKYDKVVVYGITYLMPKLAKKLDKELRPGTIVVSNYFELPHWKIKKKRGEILLYQKQ